MVVWMMSDSVQVWRWDVCVRGSVSSGVSNGVGDDVRDAPLMVCVMLFVVCDGVVMVVVLLEIIDFELFEV